MAGCPPDAGQHAVDRVSGTEHSSQDGVGFGGPGVALFGLGARLVFRRPGFEGGLLGQVEFLGRGRGAFVILFEPGHQFGGAVFHVAAPRRPVRQQMRLDAGDFIDGSFPVLADRRHAEAELPESGGE